MTLWGMPYRGHLEKYIVSGHNVCNVYVLYVYMLSICVWGRGWVHVYVCVYVCI